MKRAIGNEVFKTIVEMAYEMEVAEIMEKNIVKGIREARNYMRNFPHFNATPNVLKEVNRFHKLSYKNKKYFLRDKHQEDEDGDTKCYVACQPIYYTIPNDPNYTIDMEKWVDAEGWWSVNITIEDWGNLKRTVRDTPFRMEQIEALLDTKRAEQLTDIADILTDAFYISLRHPFGKHPKNKVKWAKYMDEKMDVFRAVSERLQKRTPVILTRQTSLRRTELERESIAFWALIRDGFPRQREWLVDALRP